MQMTEFPHATPWVVPADGNVILRLILGVRTPNSSMREEHSQQLENRHCARESAEHLMAHRIKRHSLLDDNPASG
jgi:hypothetical protein